MNMRDLVTAELKHRKRRNSRYSLRAFADYLEVNHSTLSLFLSGRRGMSLKLQQNIARKLGLDENAIREFLVVPSGQQLKRTPHFNTISLNQYEFIADWVNFAILSYLDLPKSSLDPAAIARHLNVPQKRVSLCCERLIEFGLIEKNKQGRWKQSTKPFKVDNAISTPATRAAQVGLIAKAQEVIERTRPEERSYSSVVFSCAKDDIPWAVERIKKFRRKLMKDLESKSSHTNVYALAVQLFPLSQEIP